MNYIEKRTPQDFLLTTTLFLGDLPVLCNETHVRELFSRYGELERVQLKKSDRDPHRAHLGFGFVKFSSRESAERALEELNGCFFLGRALRVGWADDYNRIRNEVKAMDPKKNRQTAQLHVSFSCRDSCQMVSEMELGGVFGVFGNVVDIAIKKNVLNKESGMQSGYAFVHFALTLGGVESAFSAAERVNNSTINNITYKCKTDQALLMQYQSLRSSDPLKALSHDLSGNVACGRAPSSRVDREYSGFSGSLSTEPRGEAVVSFMLHFSTYGSSAEPQKVYSSLVYSDVRDQGHLEKRVTQNYSTKENDFHSSFSMSSIPSSLSSSSSSSSYSMVYYDSSSFRNCANSFQYSTIYG